jgi:hypothetical protein
MDAGVSARTLPGAPTTRSVSPGGEQVRRLRTAGGTVVDVFFFRTAERALRASGGLPGRGRRIERLNVVAILRHQGDDVGAVVRGLRRAGESVGP